ncbi:TetR/AcrR family transcriptional regulator C-terminal domain-containing protein [Amycolatopsis sp. lyj-346]|uniref:TetR/AcrR family transcriptional regulator C-terminal domain-containing protein n=1 Tax=Amycolatopsis sp. lyj-346 TaxID=2789289 RepID=UPI00397CD302
MCGIVGDLVEGERRVPVGSERTVGVVRVAPGDEDREERYTYGFAIQEAALPFDSPDTATEVADRMVPQISAAEYPHLVEMATEHIRRPGYDFGDEFEFGLTVILDALTRSMPDGHRR